MTHDPVRTSAARSGLPGLWSRLPVWGAQALGDVRFAWRTLLRSRSFAVAVVSSLAVGLALTAVTLSLVTIFLVRSLPFPEIDRLYHVRYAPIGQPEPAGLSALDWRALADVVDMADASAPTRFYVGEGTEMEELGGLLAAPGALEMMGATPAIGSGFAPDDFSPSAEPVALIGHALWRSRFASDPAVVGRVVRVRVGNQLPAPVSFRIAGVLQPGFRYVRAYARGEVDLVVPLRTPMRAYMVRLRDGVPPALATARITDAVTRAATSFPPGWSGVGLESVHDSYVGEVRPVLGILSLAAGFVLLIVCANVAVLMLLRAIRRQKELAVRVALGAGRRHILRLLLAETLVLCGTASMLALALAALALRALGPTIEQHLGQPIPGGTGALGIDVPLFALTSGIALMVVLLAASARFLTAWSRPPRDSLRGGTGAGGDRPVTRWTRSALVGTELALALALLVGCGLMAQSLVNLVTTDLGIDSGGIVRARFVLPATEPPASSVRFQGRLLERAAALPNSGVALTGFPLLTEPNVREVELNDGTRVSVAPLSVSSRFFEAIRIPILEGRGFQDGDYAAAVPVAVVSETVKRRLWPDAAAIGQRLRTVSAARGAEPDPWRVVVGVARDVRQSARDTDLNDVYVPLAQVPSRFLSFYVRSDQPVSFWRDALRSTAREINSDVQMDPPVPLRVKADEQLASARFLTSVLSGFAGFAALLALLAVYGVTAYAVQQRRSEVAIRMALGATRGGVLRLFLKDSATVLLAGVVLGLAGGVSLGRLLQQHLHGVGPADGLTLAAMALAVALCAIVATCWPARRAATTDPAAVLRDC